jgi:transcriptional regulator with XRE-family HTH domain
MTSAHDPAMDDAKAGRLVATVRRHLRLRQVDVGELARVDQKVVSLIERGLLARVSVERFRRVCVALEIEPVLDLSRRGGVGDSPRG